MYGLVKKNMTEINYFFSLKGKQVGEGKAHGIRFSIRHWQPYVFNPDRPR